MGMKYVKDNIISTSQNNSRFVATKVMVNPLPFSIRGGDIVTKNVSLVITWLSNTSLDYIGFHFLFVCIIWANLIDFRFFFELLAK
jgi:hypothetical protein